MYECIVVFKRWCGDKVEEEHCEDPSRTHQQPKDTGISGCWNSLLEYHIVTCMVFWWIKRLAILAIFGTRVFEVFISIFVLCVLVVLICVCLICFNYIFGNVWYKEFLNYFFVRLLVPLFFPESLKPSTVTRVCHYRSNCLKSQTPSYKILKQVNNDLDSWILIFYFDCVVLRCW